MRKGVTLSDHTAGTILIIFAAAFAVWALMFIKITITDYNVKVRLALTIAAVSGIASGLLAWWASILL